MSRKHEPKDSTEVVDDDTKIKNADTDKNPGLIDGRVFEADRKTILNDLEKAEVHEFEKNLKKYNELAKKIRTDAIKKEREELIDSEKSPIKKYYEGSKLERLKILAEELEQTEKMAKLAKKKKQ